jgi:hypothetical protein
LSGSRWAASPRCISACVIRTGRFHCIGGCGYGAEPDKRDAFRAEADVVANTIRKEGMSAFAERYAYRPTRVQHENKNPRGHTEFKAMLAEHSAVGSANTQQGVQKERRSLYTLVEEMKRIQVPTQIYYWRRGLAMSSARHSYEAENSIGCARGIPEFGACDQHRRARGIQPNRRQFLLPGGKWPLAAPRSPRGQRVHHRNEGTS